MFLSKITFQFTKTLLKDLANPYEMHRTVMSAFPDNLQDRILFRVEDSHTLIQSETQPNWKIPAQVKEFNPNFQAGQILRFRLKANPTVKSKGQRLGIWKEDQVNNWLLRQAAQHGFEIVNVNTSKIQKQVSTKKGQDISHAAVTFDGVLKVINPNLFLETFKSGIGTAKGFGFGLLSLAKP